MSYLLDTNVICEIIRKKPHQTVLEWFKRIPDESLHISVLSLGEIRKGIETLQEVKRKERLRLWLEIELPAWFRERVLLIDREVVDRWGRLQAEMQRPISAI